jgi:hypothetical protein
MFHPELCEKYPSNNFLIPSEEVTDSGIDISSTIFKETGLIEFPQSFLRESVVQGGRSSVLQSVINTIILDGLVGPLILHNVQTFQVGFGNLAEESKHDPASGVEVSDGKFSQQEIRSNETKTEFLNGPLSPISVVSFACVIFINKIRHVVNLILHKITFTLAMLLLASSESSRNISCLALVKTGVKFSSS